MPPRPASKTQCCLAGRAILALKPSICASLQATISESCSLDSYPSSSLSESLACSLSSSLADLAGPHALVDARCGPAGDALLLDLPHLPLHFLDAPAEAAPPVKARDVLAAPVPSRALDSLGAARLLHASSSHFGALEEAAPRAKPPAAGSHALPGSPAGSPERGTPTGGLAPKLILAALSASLAARQEQQQQRRRLQQQQQEAEAQARAMAAAAAALAHAPAAATGYACACCSAVFCDESAFHAHCASLEHAMAVVHRSLAGAMPAAAAQARAAAGVLRCVRGTKQAAGLGSIQ